MAEASAPTPGLVIDQETLNHLPAFHRAIAEVLIEKGRWQLAEDENGSENRDSRHAPAETCLSDSTRDRNVCGQLFAGKIY